ncbi:MAG: hypothetical protein KAZ71_04730 [Bacteroidia bacterium]|nr:hypothetical protein [Bacteroidia bacterium]
MIVLGAIVFIFICVILIYALVLFIMAINKRRKGKMLNPLHLIHFIYLDKNHPHLMHIFGAMRSLKHFTGSFRYSHYHVLLNLESKNSKAYNILMNYEKTLAETKLENYVQNAEKEEGINLKPVKAPDSGPMKFSLFKESKLIKNEHPYPTNKGDRIVFVTDMNKFNNRIEVQVYRRHNLLNTFFINGTIEHEFNEIYLPKIELFVFTYLADDDVADKGIGLCAINYNSGELVFLNGI